MSSLESNNVTILQKNEQKAREIISKFQLKKVPAINRVTFRKKNNQIYAIENPEVYKTQGGNFIVFGEPKIDNFTEKLAAAQQSLQQQTGDKSPLDIQNDMKLQAEASEAAPAAVEDDEAPVDAGDLSADDIELVASQANVSKNKAIKALKEHKGDIVNAIMSLSK